MDISGFYKLNVGRVGHTVEYSKMIRNATKETVSRYDNYKRSILISLEGANYREEDFSTLNNSQLFRNMGISFEDESKLEQLNDNKKIIRGVIRVTTEKNEKQSVIIITDAKTGKIKLIGNVTDFLEKVDNNISEFEPYERIHSQKYHSN